MLADRRDLDAVQDIACERVHQNRARFADAKPSRAQVKHGRVVQLADRCAVRALDVVGEDLELGLRVDVRFV
jgi:hypothetical protein